jgi:hypothetical protein
MYCVIKCVKTKRMLKRKFASSVFHNCNAKKRKFASPVLNVLRWVFKKQDVGVWTRFSWLRIETGGCGNEPSGSIKCREFLD